MAKYIDADKLIQALCNTQKTWGSRLGTSWWSHSVKLKDNMVRCIKEQPTADVVEVKHGEWIPVVVYNDTCIATCSNCRRQIVERECNATAFKLENEFCRKCGAKMDGGKTE